MVLSIIQLNGKPVPDPKQQPPEASIPWKGFKTISVAASFLLADLTSPDVQAIISQYPKGFGAAVFIVIMLLRLITTTPAFSNQPINPTKE